MGSIMEEENEAIVRQFLEANASFHLVPMQQVLDEQKIPLQMGDFLKLAPHIHHTDGFFAAVIERNK